MPVYQPLPILSRDPPCVRTFQPQLIATISAGFEKGDYLIREERGSNVYFDFFEECYNFACQKGFTRMPKDEENEYLEIIKVAHRSPPGGCRYNTGRLLMVLRKKLVPMKSAIEDDEQSMGSDTDKESKSYASSSGSSSSRSRGKNRGAHKKKLGQSTITLPTDSESSAQSSAFSSCSTSFVDSWE